MNEYSIFYCRILCNTKQDRFYSLVFTVFRNNFDNSVNRTTAYSQQQVYFLTVSSATEQQQGKFTAT